MVAHYLVCTFPDSNQMKIREYELAPVEEILDRARAVSRDDDLLWSVALRLGGHTTWLSGTDYTQVPQTFVDLDGRYHMQNRYLFKRRQAGERPALLPDGRRAVSLYNEYGWGLPLWQPEGGGQIGKGALPLSDELTGDLEEHQREFMRHVENPAPPDWRDRVRQLHDRLCVELRNTAEVRLDYRPPEPFPISQHTLSLQPQIGLCL